MGEAVKFIANAGFVHRQFNSIATKSGTGNPESASNIIVIRRSDLPGPRSDPYANDPRHPHFILIGVKKGSSRTVAEEFAPHPTRIIWNDAHAGERSIRWSEDYRLVGLDVENRDGRERVTVVGKGERVYAVFRFEIEKEGTLGVAGVKTGNNAYEVHLHSLADPGFGWLPFPINQSGNPLLL